MSVDTNENKHVLDILDELLQNRSTYHFKPEVIKNYVDSKNLSINDKFLLLNCLVNDYLIFSWLDYMSLELEKMAQGTLPFTNLLCSIIRKAGADSSQHQFIKSLILIGEQNPNFGFKFFCYIDRLPDRDKIMPYAGLILGGAGKMEKECIVNYIKKKLLEDKYSFYEDEFVAIALIKALRVILTNDEKLESDIFFEVLKKASDIKNTEKIRLEAVKLNFDLFKFNKEICFENLVNLATKNSTSSLKIEIISELIHKSFEDYEKEFFLINLISETESNDIFSGVTAYLIKKHHHNRDQTFQIFLNAIRRAFLNWAYKYQIIASLSHFLNELDNLGFEIYVNKIKSQIKIEQDVHVVYTFQEVLSDYSNIYIKNQQDSVDECQKFIDNKLRELDAHYCYFKERVEQPNLDKINSSLKKYPKLCEVFGNVKNVNGLFIYPYGKDVNAKEYNFYGLLNAEGVELNANILSKLNHLCLLFSSYYPNDELRRKITSNVFSFLSELDFLNYCTLNQIEVEIEPELNSGKKLDFKIKTDNEYVLIEVITPRLRCELAKDEFFSFTGFFPPAYKKLELTIVEEFKKHDILLNVDEPLIIVVDGDYAAIDGEDIHSAVNTIVEENKSITTHLKEIWLKCRNKYVRFKVGESAVSVLS